jgi:hypothetical protein
MRYTPEQIHFLRENAAGNSFRELTELFNQHFDLSKSRNSIIRITLRYIGRNVITRKGTGRKYTPEQIQFLRDNLPGRPYKEMADLFNRFFKDSVSDQNMKDLARRNKLFNNLPQYRYKPGHVPANKGKKRKPGEKDSLPVGCERIKDGRMFVKTNMHKQGHWIWKSKHELIWEAANGPVPKGHIVIFADKNKQNFDLDNLLLVSRKELGVMNRLCLITPDKDLTKTGKAVANIHLLIKELGERSV